MSNPQSEPLVLRARDVSRGFADAISQVKYAGRRVVVTRQGRAVAAIVPLSDLEKLQAAPASADPNEGSTR